MNIPDNPDILVSYLNMKLRDEYSSLEELCEEMEIDQEAVCRRLQSSGYHYSAEARRFW